MKKKQAGLIFYEKEKKISREQIQELLSLLFYTVITVIIALLLVAAFGLHMRMSGSSMKPDIKAGDNVFINRIIYRLSTPKRWDVIAFYPSGNSNSHVMIRRVIALPGETVRIEDGIVYVDGLVQVYPGHKFDLVYDGGIAAGGGVTLGPGEYFVLCDLRNAGEDSRNANIGPVLTDYIVGKVWFTYGKGEK